MNQCVAQNQDRVSQIGLPQFQRFQHGADAVKGTFVLQQPRHRNGTVAIGISLDDSHHRNTGFCAYRVEIPPDCIQIDLDPGVIEIQENHLA